MLRRPLPALRRPLPALRLCLGTLLAVGVVAAGADAAAAITAPVRRSTTSTVPGATLEPSAATAASAGGGTRTATRAGTPGGSRTVRYRGVALQVPTGWPVVNLDTDPTACVRLDREAVYLGTPSDQQDCPAHAVGRAGTVWLAPAGATERSLAADGRAETLGGLPARILDRPVGHQRDVVLPGAGVVVRTAWGADPAPAQRAVDSIGPQIGPPVATPTPSTPPSATSTGGGGSVVASSATYRPAAAAASTVTAATTSVGKHLTGMAFDACSAPSTTTMSAWRSSPYAAVGIYIGGSMRACGDGYLNASWVSAVTRAGWGLIPIYVGPQAPCVYQSGLATISTTTAAAQGSANAVDAVVQAKRFGLGTGSVIYYDLEAYATGNASCTTAVLTFVTAWTAELRRQGYQSAVYGNPGSLMSDMSRAVAAHNAAFTPPDQVWYADWNQLQDTVDSSSYPAFRDNYWAGKRLHQYAGDHQETWGGRAVNIDSNWVDASLTGNPTQTVYGSTTLGPGSAGFVFTGPMTYWRPTSSGAMARAYWTHPTSGTGEDNGATWRPSLSTALYGVDAYVPSASNAAVGKYTITDSRGTATTNVDQSTGGGYHRIGTVLTGAGTSVVVHLGDNAGSATSKVLWADAIRFAVLATAPGSPTSVSAAPADRRATVSWAAAPANGAAIAGYTVTASPGGATATVSGSARSVTMTGLTNGTPYTFSVRARNLVGVGSASAASAPVVPTTAGRFVAITPVRVLDTRYGAPANPTLRTSVGPNRTLTFSVGGSAGPVPSGATAVVVNLTATAGTRSGHLDPAAGGSSLVNFAAGQSVANLATLRLDDSRSVSLRNVSGGSVQVVADVEGYVTPTAGGYWVATQQTRLVDTRHGTSLDARTTALRGHESITVRVADLAGSPVSAGALGAALRLTATGSTGAGYLTAGDGAGSYSTLNYTRGQVVGNVALVRLGSTGSVTITNHSGGTVDLVVDLQGELSTAGALWTPLTPARLVDTRQGTSSNPGVAVLGAGESRTVKVAGVTGSPVPAGAAAVAVNLTVVPTTSSGWLSANDVGWTRTSALNFPAGTVVAGLAMVPLAADGTMVLHNGSRGPVQVVVDVQGYAAAVR